MLEVFIITFIGYVGLTITIQSTLHKYHFYQRFDLCELCVGFWMQVIFSVFISVILSLESTSYLSSVWSVLALMPFIGAGLANRI